jgi:hypothetical protein
VGLVDRPRPLGVCLWASCILPREQPSRGYHICDGFGRTCARQNRCMAGDLRIGGTAIYPERLRDFACAIRPDRSWNWLGKAADRFGKIAAQHPSRNAGRVVEIVELRQAALGLMKAARRTQAKARSQRPRVKAHTCARTAICAHLLSEAPIRAESSLGQKSAFSSPRISGRSVLLLTRRRRARPTSVACLIWPWRRSGNMSRCTGEWSRRRRNAGCSSRCGASPSAVVPSPETSATSARRLRNAGHRPSFQERGRGLHREQSPQGGSARDHDPEPWQRPDDRNLRSDCNQIIAGQTPRMTKRKKSARPRSLRVELAERAAARDRPR